MQGLERGLRRLASCGMTMPRPHCQAFVASPELLAGPFLIQRGRLSHKAWLLSRIAREAFVLFAIFVVSMDKLKIQQKSRTARNKLAEAVSRGNGTGSLAVPPSTLAINDNASTTGVNEGFPGLSAARDFAIPERVPVPQPKIEPPTSLQSSVDAGKRVPVPPPKDVRTPKKRLFVLPQHARKVRC